MTRYRQYCPIARTSEILAERWTPLLVRNLLFGARSFSDLARGVPMMSRSMLVKRLGQLERAGVVERVGDGARRPGYALTAAGRDLAGVVAAMAEWGDRWLDVTVEDADPGFALWAWCQAQLDRAALPPGRVVVAFRFPEEAPTNRHYWLLVEHGDAELCYADPGGEPDVVVEARSLAFVDWHRGARTWADVVGSGEVEARGPRSLLRALPTWNLHHPVFA